MAYSDFTIELLKEKFGIQPVEHLDLYCIPGNVSSLNCHLIFYLLHKHLSH